MTIKEKALLIFPVEKEINTFTHKEWDRNQYKRIHYMECAQEWYDKGKGELIEVIAKRDELQKSVEFWTNSYVDSLAMSRSLVNCQEEIIKLIEENAALIAKIKKLEEYIYGESD